MEVAVTTDVGTSHRFNDDAWCHEQLHRNVTVLAVADGFGRPQGLPASMIVLDSVRDVIRRELRRATFPSRKLTANDVREMLSDAFAAGNDRLLHVSGGNQDYVAAGSTCTLVLIVSNQAFVAHVGDSRAYLLRRGELVQLTSDESLLPELVRSVSGLPDALRKNQSPTLLTRALGVEPAAAVPPKISHYTLHSHDAIALCTDGLSRTLGFADLQAALSVRDSARGATERAVTLARSAGSVDNATIILVRNATVHGAPSDFAPANSATPWRRAAALVAALSLFVAAGSIVRTYWFGDAHLYLAPDERGHVGLFAGAPGSFLGLPLHAERTSFGIAVSRLSPSDQRKIAEGLPVTTPLAASSVVARWQAQSRR